MEVKRDAIINVITKSGKSICGRYAGERNGNIRIVLQRKVIPDDKLLGDLHDRSLIRCSKDFGEPIDIPIGNLKTWSYARYNEMCFLGEPEKKEYFWPFFHYIDAGYLNIEECMITQYNSAGYFKGIKEEPQLEE